MKASGGIFPWAAALVMGSAVAVVLFTILPELTEMQIEPEKTIEIDFAQWREPEQTQEVNIAVNNPAPAAVRDVAENSVQEPDPVAPAIALMPAIEKQVPPPEKQVTEEPARMPLITPKEEFIGHNERAVKFDERMPEPTPIYELTAMPRFLHKVEPEFPESMRSLGREGQVGLEVLVDANGRVRKVTILRSGGDAFDEAARAALYASKFAPGNVKGKPVAVLMRMPISFLLN